jgi:hypothetical protein
MDFAVKSSEKDKMEWKYNGRGTTQHQPKQNEQQKTLKNGENTYLYSAFPTCQAARFCSPLDFLARPQFLRSAEYLLEIMLGNWRVRGIGTFFCLFARMIRGSISGIIAYLTPFASTCIPYGLGGNVLE